MSIEAVAWVLSSSPTKGAERMVLMVLAEHARSECGHTWPSYATVAGEANVSERWAKTLVKRLITAGHVKQVADGGGRQSNVYEVVGAPRSGERLRSPLRCSSVHPRGELTDTPGVMVGSPEPLVNPQGTVMGVAGAPEAGNSPRRKRRTEAPDLLPVTDKLRAWAAKEGITANLDAETEKMLDHYRGTGERFADWQAVRKNWLRKGKEFAERDRRRGRGGDHPRFVGGVMVEDNVG
ncbi:MAG TPA: helix-turn-helix domain-containing protein [Acidimicrobiales bacterium]|jgi:hypothetical protein